MKIKARLKQTTLRGLKSLERLASRLSHPKHARETSSSTVATTATTDTTATAGTVATTGTAVSATTVTPNEAVNVPSKPEPEPEMDYSQEVPHSEHLVVQGTEPFNAEPTAAALVEFPITPEELVYCRNHGPVLELDEDTYTVAVHGTDVSAPPRKFTLQELRTTFPRAEVVAALQVSF